MAAFIRFYKKLLISLRLILETRLCCIFFFPDSFIHTCVAFARARARVCVWMCI